MRPRVPSYCLHKPTGQAVVTLAAQFDLGKYGSPESRTVSNRVVDVWLSSRPAAHVRPADVTLSELMIRMPPTRRLVRLQGGRADLRVRAHPARHARVEETLRPSSARKSGPLAPSCRIHASIFGVGDASDFRAALRGTRKCPMNKQYEIVRLSDEERGVCQDIVKRLKGTSEKVKRAQILLKADADGPGWPDAKITEAFDCSVRTVENLRERLVTAGFDAALERKKRAMPPTPCKLDGVGEAKLIAMRLGKPRAGYGRWSLLLLLVPLDRRPAEEPKIEGGDSCNSARAHLQT